MEDYAQGHAANKWQSGVCTQAHDSAPHSSMTPQLDPHTHRVLSCLPDRSTFLCFDSRPITGLPFKHLFHPLSLSNKTAQATKRLPAPQALRARARSRLRTWSLLRGSSAPVGGLFLLFAGKPLWGALLSPSAQQSPGRIPSCPTRSACALFGPAA